MSSPIDLALGILDHQLVDCDGRRCGKADDLELEGVAEGAPRVAAILTGPPVWRGRGLMGRVAAAVARGATVRVPWEEVAEVHSAVELRRPARELRLGRGDDRARPLVEKVPGSSL
jgi:hypothetical protein